MNFSAPPEKVLRDFEFRNLLMGLFLVLISIPLFRQPRAVFSVLLGVGLSLLLFQYLKRDGREIAARALAGVPHGKILRSFLFKYYLRLLAVGLFLGSLFYFRLIHPVTLTLGLSVEVIQLFWTLLEKKKKKILAQAR